MGIDIHNLNLLAHARDIGVSFERTLGVGRQALFIEPDEVERHRALRRLPALKEPPVEPGKPRYFEPLLQQWLGAATVDAVDASPYENARLIHDMNLTWPTSGALAVERGQYDAVLDFGCLEHVFNFPVAWRNCVDVCRVGGHVLHSLPANNLSGHGFYQFSPELFFNLYQPSRGFELRGIYFAVHADNWRWWRVANPMDVKRRVNLRNSHEVYMLVVARKLREVEGELPAPQQSDYAQDEWLKAPAAAASATSSGDLLGDTRRAMVNALSSLGLRDAARTLRESLRALRQSSLALPEPDYQPVNVKSLLSGGSRP